VKNRRKRTEEAKAEEHLLFCYFCYFSINAIETGNDKLYQLAGSIIWRQTLSVSGINNMAATGCKGGFWDRAHHAASILQLFFSKATHVYF